MSALLSLFDGVEELNQKDLTKTMKEVLQGKEVTITGYMTGLTGEGHAQVRDLTKPMDRNIRLIDVRTVKDVIFRGVRYTYRYA